VNIAVVVGVLGLLIGSFLNVVAHRVPNGESVVSPPSSCPKCGRAIRPRDNIPVLGWILLRGACRDCGEPISIRYPIVEAVTGVLFALTTWVIGPGWDLPAHLWFVGLSIAFILTDLEHHRLPNRMMLPGTIVGVVLLGAGAVLEGRIADFGIGLLAGVGNFALFLGLALIARGGFGMGDVKLAFIIGVFTGYHAWPFTPLASFLAFLIGGTVSIVLLALRVRGRKDAIPFGPPMIVASWLAIAWGRPILDWYLG
jgi:leader peptidase (prepilin peptidase)/N-methyltransferase